MKLYADSSREFVRATTQNRIVDRLRHAFEDHYRHPPAPSEINAWNNSLKAMALLISEARLDDNGVGSGRHPVGASR